MTAPWLTHNPAFLDPDLLVERFVVRLPELAGLIRVLRENTGAVNQHVLVLGPRGSGKSTLVRRLAQEVRKDDDLARRWLPVVFGEESYQVNSLGALWLEAVLHLADALHDEALHCTWETLRSERDERTLRAAARACLLDVADRLGRRLLLVVENLDSVIEAQLDEDDGWALREALLSEPRLMLLGTAVRRFEGVDQPDRPLFDLLRRVELAPLDEPELRALWTALAGVDPGVHRSQALRVLTGGNARLAVLLGGFADGADLGVVLGDLTGLVDRHTEYFKHNVEALSAQQRQVFLALADRWAPATAGEVAETARVDANKVSVQLGRLVADGRVQTVELYGERRYQVAERLYNIYYLMRRRGGAEPRVRALLEFVRHFYPPEEVPHLVGRFAGEASELSDLGRTDHLRVVRSLLDDLRGRSDLLASGLGRIPRPLWRAHDAKGLRELADDPAVVLQLVQGPDGWRWWGHATRLLESFAAHVQEGDAPVSEAVLALARWALAHGDRILALDLLLAAGAVDDLLARAPRNGGDRSALAATLLNRSSALAIRHPIVLEASRAVRAWDAAESLGVVFTAGRALAPQDLVNEALRDGRSDAAWRGVRWMCAAHPDWRETTDLLVRLVHVLPAERVREWTVAWVGEDPGNPFARFAADPDAFVGSEDLESAPPALLAHGALFRPSRQEAVRLLRAALDGAAGRELGSAWYALLRFSEVLDPESLPGVVDQLLRETSSWHVRGLALHWLTGLPRGAAAVAWLARVAEACAADLPLTWRVSQAFGAHGLAARAEQAAEDFFGGLPARYAEGGTELALRFAAAGREAFVLELLRSSPSAALYEPVFHALAVRAGERSVVPAEVQEIARHVRQRIDALAATGDPWRADLAALPVEAPAPPEPPATPAKRAAREGRRGRPA